jgi:hypothetical protein
MAVHIGGWGVGGVSIKLILSPSGVKGLSKRIVVY